MFEKTKKAIDVFQNAIECVQCKTKKKDLQYLGTSCKHAFCWDCISDCNRKVPGRRSTARPQCPSCAFPLDTTKITGSHLLNTCYGYLEDLRPLLQNAALLSMTQSDIACTQRAFVEDQNIQNQNQNEAVERFLETQGHMPDELGQTDEEELDSGMAPNRENTNSPELDLFHDYSSSKETETGRSSTKRSSTTKELERKPKRSSVLKASVKNEISGPTYDLFASQVPQRMHENDLLTPFVNRRSTAPPSSGVGKYAQPFASSEKSANKEDDPFTKTIVLKKRQASLDQMAKKEPRTEIDTPSAVFTRTRKNSVKQESIDRRSQSPTSFEQPSVSSKGRKSSIKLKQQAERRSQSPMSFGERSMSLKPEQRRSSYGTRRGEVVIINSILNNRIPQLQSAVDAGTCVNEKDNEGKTPLYIAVEHNSLEAVRILVEAGAIINASCGPSFETTLHEAVRRNNPQMIEYLLSRGASMKTRNIAGKTAEDLAKSDSKLRKILEKFKNETRVLQPLIPPPKSRIHFVQLIDDQMLTESEKQRLPGKINIVASEMETPTHVVVDVNPKTLVLNISKEYIGEVLKAIIKPGMVVRLDWLKACIKDPSKVDDDVSYAVKKVQWMEGQMFENTIELWKKTINKMQPKLFAGCKFYIPRPKYNFLDRASLIEIVRSAGGYASSRDSPVSDKDPPPYHNSNLKPNFVLYSLTFDIGDKFRDCSRYNLVSEQWLIESILSCSINTPPH